MAFNTFIKRFEKKLAHLALIERWNDHPRPFDITELDKQGHKAIVSFLFAKIEEQERAKTINWIGLIEGLIFEALQRAIFTDLKPQLFHKLLRTQKGKLNKHLFESYKNFLQDFSPSLWRRFVKYFSDEEFLNSEKHIIRAAHFIPTYWEFQFIYPVARAMYTIEKTKKELEDTLEDFHNLVGIQRFLLKRKLYGFINLCGQLRFQKRWISVERIPQTSVMGHIFTVASLVYLLMVFLNERYNLNISRRAIYSTFFTALFHDLPEIITRDIISTLKDILGKDEIRKIEIDGLESEVLNLLPNYIADEIRIFLGLIPQEKVYEINEFTDRWVVSGNLKSFEDLEFLSSEEGYPIWGSLVKLADWVSAYWEADWTLKHGLRNEELERARKELRKKIENHQLVKRFPFLKEVI
jgi:putative hydrolase of HD superfamily